MENHYVIAHSRRGDMIATGFYGSGGRIVEEKRLAAKFHHLADILEFVQKYRIKLNQTNFVLFG